MQKPTSGDSKYFLSNIFRHDFTVFCSVYVVHLCVPACRNCKYIVKFSLHIYSVLAQLQFGQCSEMLFTPFKNRVSMQHTQFAHKQNTQLFACIIDNVKPLTMVKKKSLKTIVSKTKISNSCWSEAGCSEGKALYQHWAIVSNE